MPESSNIPTLLPMPHGFIDNDDSQVYFETWGEGPETVVLAHGMGGHHAVWYQQVPALAERYRVVTWDQRGFGRSSRGSRPIGPETAAADLTRILDHLDVDRAHVVGQSMGGWAALRFAIDNPHRTGSLVLADTTAGIFDQDIRNTLGEYGSSIAAGPPPDQWPLGYHPAVGEHLADEDLAQSFLYGQLGSLTNPPSPLKVIELLMRADNTEGAAGLAVPTLFVVGENDPIFPPSLIEQAASVIPGSQVAVISDTGHSPYFERPDVWNDTVMTFLADSQP